MPADGISNDLRKIGLRTSTCARQDTEGVPDGMLRRP